MRTKTLALAGLTAVLLTACSGGDGDAAAGSSASASSSASSSSGSSGSAGANGEAGKTGTQVADDAATAVEKAGSLHATGTASDAGTQQQVDLQLQGDDVAGSITTGGVRLDLIGTGGQLYAKAPAAFWTASGAPEAAAAQLDGVWVTVPSGAADQLGEFSLKGLVAELRAPTGTTIADEVGTDTIAGQDVVVVEQSDGSTVAVAATGTPYPLREVETGDSAGTVMYSGFGEKQPIAAPPSPVDLSQVAGG